MMTADDRAFASSLDADQEGHEGRFYVWTPDQARSAIGSEDGAFFATRFDVTPDGNWEGASIPNRLGTGALSDEDEIAWAAIRPRLLAARARRTPPGRDDKVLADWNAMAIASLARAGRQLGEPGWIDLAREVFRFVCESMSGGGEADFQGPGSRLGHSWRNGRLVLPGLATDHAQMIRAALALHECDPDHGLVRHAVDWAETMEALYLDEDTGGYFLTPTDAAGLIVRPRSALDEATPNANGVMAEALLRLAAVTGEDRWRRRADEILIGLSPQIAANVFGHASLLNALDSRLVGAEIVVTGRGSGALVLREAALALPYPTRTVSSVDDPAGLRDGHPAASKAPAGEEPRAYVCVGHRCSLPVGDAAALVEAHGAMRRG